MHSKTSVFTAPGAHNAYTHTVHVPLSYTHREHEKERHRQTDRQTDRQTETEREKEGDELRQTQRQAVTLRYREFVLEF